jgi:hypothetical protein
MNKVSYYFGTLVSAMKEKQGFTSTFSNLLISLSIHFNNHLKSEKRFTEKIANCIANFSALNLVVNKNVNKAENTIKTIQCCLQNGIIFWIRKDDKFSYKIKTNMIDSI